MFKLPTLVLASALLSLSAQACEGLRQGSLYVAQLEPGQQALYKQEKVRIDPQGYFVLGFDRDADLKQGYRLQEADGSSRWVNLALCARDYDIQRIEGIAKKMMAPSAKDLKRIRAEAVRVRTARKQDLAQSHFKQNFIWPVTGRISGVYGSQRFYNGEARRPHYGVDVAVPTGTPVVAPADATISLAEDDLFFSGGTLIMDHGHGLSSSFLHLSKLHVKVGDQVKQGDVVAEVGATGRVTGPHLDWRMNWFKAQVDPVLLVGDMP